MAKIYARNTTYCGVPCRVVERREGGPLSERLIFMHWLGDADPANGGYAKGTITARRVKGDGRTSKFRVIESTRVVTEDELPPEIIEKLRGE